jgi:hypothetical protein
MKLWMWSIAAGTFLATMPPSLSETENPTGKEKAPVSQTDKDKASQETEGSSQPQPQGPTGPIDTSSGGAPPSSPQGDTPPGMQPDQQKSPAEADPKKGSGQ